MTSLDLPRKFLFGFAMLFWFGYSHSGVNLKEPAYIPHGTHILSTWGWLYLFVEPPKGLPGSRSQGSKPYLNQPRYLYEGSYGPYSVVFRSQLGGLGLTSFL